MQSPDTNAVAALIVAVANVGNNTNPFGQDPAVDSSAQASAHASAERSAHSEEVDRFDERFAGLNDKIGGLTQVSKLLAKRSTVDDLLEVLRAELHTQHKRDMLQMRNDMQQVFEERMQEFKGELRAQTLHLHDSVFGDLVTKTSETTLQIEHTKLLFSQKFEQERAWSLATILEARLNISAAMMEMETLRLTSESQLARDIHTSRATFVHDNEQRQIVFQEDMRKAQTEMATAIQNATQALGHESNAAKLHVLNVIEKKSADMERRISDNTEKIHEDNLDDIKSHVAQAVGAVQLRCTELEDKIEHAQIAEKARRTQEARSDAEQARRAEEARSDAEQARRAEEARRDAEQARRTEEARSDAEQARRAEETRGNAMRAESPRAAFPPAAHHTTQFSHRLSSEHNKGLNAEPTYVRDCPPGMDRNHKSFVHENGDLFTEEEYQQAMDQLRASLLREEQQDALCRTPTPYASASSMQSTASKRSSVRNIDVLATTINNALQSGSFQARGGAIWDDLDAAGSGPAAGGQVI